ncbi:MAG: tetratricopeptide repeat protein [Cyanobacteria bacterium SZAS-4]|nr:tetratricopeptide repeat protein [Cyanobacteria bacterium SZAS-4]
MNSKNRITRSAICLAQTVLLLAGNVSVAFAATGTASNSSLDTFEKSIFGETHTKLSETTRLKDLEMNLFGKTHSGTTASRISEISKALGGAKNDNLLLPAMAPQLDTSSGDVVRSAPSASRDSYSDDSPITASGDAEKETLRNAMRLYQQGKTDEAEKQFRKALSINKNSSDAYYNLGVIAEGKGDLQGALNSYRSAARINPSDTDLASAISSLETKLQDKANADQRQRQMQQQAALDQQEQRKTENLKQMINTAATAYKNHDYDKAISNLQYVSQQAPTDGDVAYALGQAYKGKGDYSRARAAYNNAIASDPSNSLYKDALSNLNQVTNNSSNSGSSADGFPAAAPDRKRNRPGQITGFSGGNNYGGGNTGYSSASNDAGSGYGGGGGSSAGQLTPFSGVANGNTSIDDDGDQFSNLTAGGIGPQQGYVSSSGRSFSFGGGLGNLGSLGSITSLLGAGSMGSMLGGGVRYNGYNSGYGGRYSGTSTRIKRVAIGGLGGAAAGALYGQMGGRGSVKSSAMKGALMGAAMGLFMGGF